MKIISQNTPEWYDVRKGKFTASNFGKLMTPPRDRYREWSQTAMGYIGHKAQEKYFDMYIESSGFTATEWGHEHEEKALQLLQERMRVNLSETGFILHPQYDEIGATPDAMILSQNGDTEALVQVKCPHNRSIHADYCDKIHDTFSLERIAKKYYWQMQGEMWVAGINESWFVSYDPRSNEDQSLHCVKIKLVPSAIKELEDTLLKALEKRDELMDIIRQKKQELYGDTDMEGSNISAVFNRFAFQFQIEKIFKRFE